MTGKTLRLEKNLELAGYKALGHAYNFFKKLFYQQDESEDPDKTSDFYQPWQLATVSKKQQSYQSQRSKFAKFKFAEIINETEIKVHLKFMLPYSG